jgi:hypothetical protein
VEVIGRLQSNVVQQLPVTALLLYNSFVFVSCQYYRKLCPLLSVSRIGAGPAVVHPNRTDGVTMWIHFWVLCSDLSSVTVYEWLVAGVFPEMVEAAERHDQGYGEGARQLRAVGVHVSRLFRSFLFI